MSFTTKVSLGKVSDINPTIPLDVLERNSVAAFIPMSAVSAETASIESITLSSISDVRKGFTPFITGDILLAKITPCYENGKIAHAKIANEIGFGSTEFHVIRPHKDKIDARYILHFLRQKHVRIAGEKRMTGTGGQRRVPASFLSEIEIPLPSLEEQRRIAKILDHVEALRAKRHAALTHLDSLIQSIFLDLFGDPVANIKRWKTSLLENHATKIGSGATPSGGETSYKNHGISLIRSLNIRDGNFSFKDLAFIDTDQAAKLAGVIVEKDDVLLNITGASVARVCRAPASVLPARVNQHVCIIRPKSTLNPIFLEKLLLSPQFKKKLLKIGGAGATREAITKAEIQNLEIITPPIELQQKFALTISSIERLICSHRASLAELDALFTSLQHRAFRGEL